MLSNVASSLKAYDKGVAINMDIFIDIFTPQHIQNLIYMLLL